MGLRAPFGYVDYEYTMAVLFHTILDRLCAHCNTNDDYQEGCKSCPAGVLIFACRDYILTAGESDKHHELYISEEWLSKRRKLGYPEQTEEEKKSELRFISDYQPECDLLRDMKRVIKGITPHPFFYVKYSEKRGYERPKRLQRFMELVGKFREAQLERSQRWGLIKEVK